MEDRFSQLCADAGRGVRKGKESVSGTSGIVCELATAKDIQIRDKNEVPQIEKVVDDNDGTVEIGQVLTYTITGKVPSTKGYTEFTYQVTDTMTEGLTFNKDVKVTIGGVDVTSAATITNNENGFVASVNMMNYQDQIDAPVVITYTATVNEKAIQREKETNAATLKYSNNPADKTTFEESSVEVDVFSFNIVINKYAANNAETKLEGAKFVLKNNEGKYYKYDAATKAVTWVAAKADATEVSTDANGAARFDGLQAGTYSLEETVAPAGYNQLTKDITIVLDKQSRMDDEAGFLLTGRDIEQCERVIRFDKARCRWVMQGTAAQLAAQRRVAEYEAEPIVKTLRVLLQQGDGTWSGNAQALMQMGERYTNEELASSTRALAGRIKELQPMLWERDAIKCWDKQNGTGGKRYCFKMNRIDNTAPVMDSAQLSLRHNYR